jgi:hypothetical protein
VIVKGKCFSDCLVPLYIEVINDILDKENITYDVNGIKKMCNLLRLQFKDNTDNEMNQTLRDKYTTELE